MQNVASLKRLTIWYKTDLIKISNSIYMCDCEIIIGYVSTRARTIGDECKMSIEFCVNCLIILIEYFSFQVLGFFMGKALFAMIFNFKDGSMRTAQSHAWHTITQTTTIVWSNLMAVRFRVQIMIDFEILTLWKFDAIVNDASVWLQCPIGDVDRVEKMTWQIIWKSKHIVPIHRQSN